MRAKYALIIIMVIMWAISGWYQWYAFDKDEATQIHATNVYMLVNAVNWVMVFMLVTLLASGLIRQFGFILLSLFVGKVIDEVWFDPTVPSWNDLVNLLIAEHAAIIVITIHFVKQRYVRTTT